MKLYFLLFVVLAYSCSEKIEKTNNYGDFYQKSGSFDYRRLPVLKPYAAISVDKINWDISLPDPTKLRQGEITKASEIFVRDSIILVYCSDSTILRGSRVEHAWFILNLKNNTEVGFDNLKSFQVNIEHLEVNEVRWLDINAVWKNFSNTGKLPWMGNPE